MEGMLIVCRWTMKTFEDISDRVFPAQDTQHGPQEPLSNNQSLMDLSTRLNEAASNASISEVNAEYNQHCSPLLRLPGEIRNLIYGYAIGGHLLVSKYTILGRRHHKVIVGSYITARKGPRPRACREMLQLYSRILESDELKLIPSSTGDILARTCRQLRHETGILRYTLNTLQFDTHGDIENLLRSYPSLATSLTHVALSIWDACEIGGGLDLISQLPLETFRATKSSDFRFATAFQNLAGLKKITLLNDWRDARFRFPSRETGTSETKETLSPAVTDPCRLAMRACIKKGVQVQIMLFTTHTKVRISRLGWVVGGGEGNDIVSKLRWKD